MILIVDCGSSKTPQIQKIIDEFVDCEVLPLFEIDHDLLKNYTGVILSGAPILLTEEKTDDYLNSSVWIKNIEIPLLGICFGHQLMHPEAYLDRLASTKQVSEVSGNSSETLNLYT